VDATKGVSAQTRRHARICAFMGIEQFVFAVNKMDLVGYSQEAFEGVRRQIDELRNELGLRNVKIIPLSATEGANVTKASADMPWYDGGALLPYLEDVRTDTGRREEGFYMPVQRVCRPDLTFRGFQGQIEAGEIRCGDAVTVLPSGNRAKVKRILVGDKDADAAVQGQGVTLELDREVDVSRGCVLAKGTQLYAASRFEATLLWMDDEPWTDARSMFVKVGTRMIPGKVTGVRYVVDVNSGEHRNADTLRKNEIASCTVELSQAIIADTFSNHRTLGELILIDRMSAATSACGVIERVFASRQREPTEITPEVRARYMGQTPFVVLTDTPEEASAMERRLADQGLHTMRPNTEPQEALFAAKLLQEAGLITILSCRGLEAETVGRLYGETRSEWILDLRKGGPEKDRALYENIVNYSFF
ncbi:MAG: sulfate adenylyltransferase, partial [Oscillospiraceae bacterium]|nr:sulfate adenylyltransferase [Oscillospiraceae bacterium]